MCGGGQTSIPQTPQEKALGDIAVQRWNDYQSRFVPIENQLIHQVQQTSGNYDQVRGQSNASVQQAFAPKQAGLENNLFAQGITPGSGHFINTLASMGRDRALSQGTGQNEANLAVDNNYLKNMEGLVQMGQGQAATAISGLGSAAGRATNNAITRANTSFRNHQAALQLGGQVAGMGAAGTGLFDPAAGGTATNPGTFGRVNYNMATGKGGY